MELLKDILALLSPALLLLLGVAVRSRASREKEGADADGAGADAADKWQKAYASLQSWTLGELGKRDEQIVGLAGQVGSLASKVRQAGEREEGLQRRMGEVEYENDRLRGEMVELKEQFETALQYIDGLWVSIKNVVGQETATQIEAGVNVPKPAIKRKVSG